MRAMGRARMVQARSASGPTGDELALPVVLRVQPLRPPLTADHWLTELARLPVAANVRLDETAGDRLTVRLETTALFALAQQLEATASALIPGALPVITVPEPGILDLTWEQGAQAAVAPRRRSRAWLAVAGALMPAAIVLYASLTQPGWLQFGGSASEPTVAPPAVIEAQPIAPPVRRWEKRELGGVCVTAQPGVPCDPLTAALWAGDTEAWRQWAALNGEAPPTAAAVWERTIKLRLGAGDVAARVEMARILSQPLPVIVAVEREGEGRGGRLTTLLIDNLGAAPADLSGATVAGVGRFAPGVRLAPGQRCTVTLGGDNAGCPLTGTAAELPNPARGATLRLTAADGRELDAFQLP